MPILNTPLFRLLPRGVTVICGADRISLSYAQPTVRGLSTAQTEFPYELAMESMRERLSQFCFQVARLRFEASPVARLTRRERQVLGLIATGASNSAIAATLNVTSRAVEKHINSIFTKLDLPAGDRTHRRVAAVLLYLGDSGSVPDGHGSRGGQGSPVA